MPFPLNSGLGGFSSNTVVSGQQAGIGNSPEFTGLTFEPYIIELPVADPSFAGSTPIFVNDLTSDGGLDPRISISRASTAWDFDKNGKLVSFPSNVPRIGWDPDGQGNWIKNGALIEPQRTNLLLQSGDLTNAAWFKGNVTLSNDGTTGPNGTLLKATVNSTTANTTHAVVVNATFAIVSGTVYTCSAYVKAGTKSFVGLNLEGNASQKYITAVFDLTSISNTSASQTSVGTTSGTLIATGQQYIGGGVFRIWMTGSVADTAAFLEMDIANAATGNTLNGFGEVLYTGTLADTAYFGVPQVEAGAFPTSPIITTTAAVTRSADIMSSTDAGLLGAQAWSIETADMQAATAATILGVNTAIGIQAKADNTLGYDTGAQATANTADWTGVNRSFFAFDGTPRVSIDLDGGTVVTSGTTPLTPTTLYFGNTNNGSSGFLNGRLRRLAAYTSLDDTQGVEASTPFASFLIETGVVGTDNAALAATEAPDVVALAVTETINAALAATEAPDVAAFVVTETINAALTATEAQDVAAFAVAVKISAALAATEAQDTAAFVVIETDTAVLAATEAKDVAAFVANLTTNVALAATEASDTAAIVATIGDNAALAATEVKDVAAIIVIETDTAVLAATEAQDVAVFVATVSINAALAATEAKDAASINASGGINVALAAAEAQDVAAFVAIETDTAILTATEDPDVASIVATVLINAALSAAEAQDVAAFTVSIVSAGAVSGSFAVVEASDTVHFLINYADVGLPTSKFIYPRVKEPYDPNLDLTIMRKAFTSKNWENYLRLVNIRGNDVYGYNGEVSQTFLTAEPMLDPITGALAINFLINDGRQFLVDIPDDMPGIYRGVLMGMIEA